MPPKPGPRKDAKNTSDQKGGAGQYTNPSPQLSGTVQPEVGSGSRSAHDKKGGAGECTNPSKQLSGCNAQSNGRSGSSSKGNDGAAKHLDPNKALSGKEQAEGKKGSRFGHDKKKEKAKGT